MNAEQGTGYWLVIDPDGGEDARFKARNSVPKWMAMKVMVAGSKGDEIGQMALFMDLVMATLLPEEHERFDAYMSEHDEAFDKLGDAVSKLYEEQTNRPLQQPSPSSTVSTPIEQQSRVVSFSRGTVETAPVETSSSTL